MNSESKLITAQEVAELFSLSVDTVWRYTRENRIPFIEVGNRQYRYCKDDVLRALSEKKYSDMAKEKKATYPISILPELLVEILSPSTKKEIELLS